MGKNAQQHDGADFRTTYSVSLTGIEYYPNGKNAWERCLAV